MDEVEFTLRGGFGEQRRRAPVGTPIGDLFDDESVVAALLNHHVVSLATPIVSDCAVEGVRADEPLGEGIVRRSLGCLLRAVVHERFPSLRPVIGQSIFGGDFFHLTKNGQPLPSAQFSAIRDAMAELVERDLPFVRKTVPIEAAPSNLSSLEESAPLLRSWPRPTVNLVTVDNFVDLHVAPVVPSTGVLKGFELVPFESGCVLRVRSGGEATAASAGTQALYRVCEETFRWNETIGVSTLADLNGAILDDRAEEVIRVSEALHENKLAAIAETIAGRGELRIVCVAGPSSAGKTTFVRRLQVQLLARGIRPVVLSLDDYYRNRSETPRDAGGELDFEVLDALDLSLLQKHLAAISTGAKVETPSFDFERGQRRRGTRSVHLADDEILLVEGIHGLNPSLVPDVEKGRVFRVYVNALSQLIIAPQHRIPTTDVRLLRRIIRDRQYRGTTAAETIARWPSVRRGEERHIFPFQGLADATFNAALIYEPAVFKTLAWRFLLEVDRDDPARRHAYRLLRFLELVIPLPKDAVPQVSVLREFVGGSGFSY